MVEQAGKDGLAIVYGKMRHEARRNVFLIIP